MVPEDRQVGKTDQRLSRHLEDDLADRVHVFAPASFVAFLDSIDVHKTLTEGQTIRGYRVHVHQTADDGEQREARAAINRVIARSLKRQRE